MKKKWILGIDASRSARKNPTGTELYSTSIIQALIKEMPDAEFRLYTPEWIDNFPKKMQVRMPMKRLWTLFRLSLEMLFHKPDILFIPAHVLPFFAPRKSMVTIHDIAYEKIPNAYSRTKRWYLKWSTIRALKKAAKIFVPTEVVKKDLIHFYAADPHKIYVVPHGITPLPKVSALQIKKLYARLGLNSKEPVFFFLGRLESKKNIVTLVEAWEIVQKMYSKGRLMLAGGEGYGVAEIKSSIERHGLEKSIILSGYLSPNDAACLFEAADCFIYPSREEGFGLPILQAFHANCLVIASDIPVLREVAGSAALFADPDNSKDFAEQMMRILEDKKLCELLRQEAKIRIKQFSWEKSAKLMAFEFKESSLNSRS